MLSGNDTSAERQEGLKAGANDYLKNLSISKSCPSACKSCSLPRQQLRRHQRNNKFDRSILFLGERFSSLGTSSILIR